MSDKFDLNAEMLILGEALKSIEALDYCIENLESKMFFDEKHSIIFDVIKKIYLQGYQVDEMSLIEALKTQMLLEKVGGIQYISILYSYYLNSIDLEIYVNKIINLHQIKCLDVYLLSSLSKLNKENVYFDDIKNDLLDKIDHISSSEKKEYQTAKDVFDQKINGKTFEEHDIFIHDQVKKGLSPYVGVSSGYEKLDNVIGSFEDGCVYIIGGRTSMGKTTFLLNLIKNMLHTQKIGFFSCEMTLKVLLNKLACMSALVDYKNLGSGRCTVTELQSIAMQRKNLEKSKIFMFEESGIKINSLLSKARRLKKREDINVLFIDYLTLIKPDSKEANNHLQVSAISKAIQALAKELKIPIIVLAQLNRQVTSREDKRPSLSDFRESGAIEEDADCCMLIHRPEYYDSFESPGKVELRIAKNRQQGELKTLYFTREKGDNYKELTIEIKKGEI